MGQGQQHAAQPPLGSEGHRAPSEDSLTGGKEKGGRAGKQGKFTLFNLRHPGKVRDTSTGSEKTFGDNSKTWKHYGCICNAGLHIFMSFTVGFLQFLG